MRRIQKIVFSGLLACFLAIPVVLYPGQSMSESAKAKAQEEWQKVKKDAKEAERELKESGKQAAGEAKKESKKIGETFKDAG